MNACRSPFKRAISRDRLPQSAREIFRAGIRAYMMRHAYSNTTTADLWGALQVASGKPVTAVAAAYTEQGGIPLVIAQNSCAGDTQRITLRHFITLANDLDTHSSAVARTAYPRRQTCVRLGLASTGPFLVGSLTWIS
jgi:hypothetical protein